MSQSSPSDNQPDAGFAQRLAQAALVVSGTATSITPVSPPRPGSTHQPNWCQATIAIDSIEKGAVAGKSIQVLFAASEDIAWHRSPKIARGDHKVFLLQEKDPFGKPTPGPAVVDPLDVRPLSDLPQVRSLVKSKQ